MQSCGGAEGTSGNDEDDYDDHVEDDDGDHVEDDDGHGDKCVVRMLVVITTHSGNAETASVCYSHL